MMMPSSVKNNANNAHNTSKQSMQTNMGKGDVHLCDKRSHEAWNAILRIKKILLAISGLQNIIIVDGNPSGIHVFCLGLAYGIMQGFFETFFIKNMINKTLLLKNTFKTINDDI